LDRLACIAAAIAPSPRWTAVLLVLAGALLFAPVAPATAPCWDRLTLDWLDGRIDKTYPIPCYQQAVDRLDTDLENYTNIREDILHALAVTVTKQSGGAGTQETTSPVASDASGSLPLPLIVLGALALLLVATGAGATAWRRVHRGGQASGD
jgi:hypothetical protein